MSSSLPPPSVPAPSFLTIPSKPNSPISYTFIPSSSSSSNHKTDKSLVVFLNGLGLPASSWLPSINLLIAKHVTHPAILKYDRFGQGLTTSRDPLDGIPGREKGHTFEDVVKDLEELLQVVVSSHMTGKHGFGVGNSKQDTEIFMIGASIGVPLLRLYAQSPARRFPLAGALFLDSNIANTAYSDITPHPSSAAFKDHMEKYLGDDCTLEEYTKSRDILVGMFDFDVPNREGLDRRGCPELLPRADGPRLEGEVDLTVVGHDSEVFIEGSWEKIGVHRRVSRVIDDFWQTYNQDLKILTSPEKSRGVVIAKGCGHFIQEDNPSFVAEEISGLLERLGW